MNETENEAAPRTSCSRGDMGSDKFIKAREAARQLGLATGVAAPGETEFQVLKKRTRQELLKAARALDLKGVSKLVKEVLARRVLDRLRSFWRSPSAKSNAVETGAAQEQVPTQGEAQAQPEGKGEDDAPSLSQKPAEQQEPAAMAKLDLGPAARAEARPVEHIPWGYGMDRVTAAAVDPETLFVYWEVTDPAIERARGDLGQGGPGAWLSLRVYDTTGRLFDGTNAHGYFDQRVERSDRQWFFTLRKPSSAAFVEIGMKSTEGYFVKIARSGRVDFPRKDAAGWREPEWMQVVATTGEATLAGTGMPARAAHPKAPAAPPPTSSTTAKGEQTVHVAAIAPWWVHESFEGHELHFWESFGTDWERVAWSHYTGEGWYELEKRVEWSGPAVMTSWEAGPFTYPVEVESPRREAWNGPFLSYKRDAVTHVLYGPWQVVIHNLGGHSSRAVLGRWEIRRSWATSVGKEIRPGSMKRIKGAKVNGGASDRALMGASGRMWVAGSELRLAGGSEVWRKGASEIRLRGASERIMMGASQRMLKGASERRLLGASEVRLAGASERRLAGASERRLAGASERRLAGASEKRLVGASERHLVGASERRLAGASELLRVGASEVRLGASERLLRGAAETTSTSSTGDFPASAE